MIGNEQYRAQKIVSDNGIDNVRAEFRRLLDGSEPAERRYWRFLNEVKGFGPASVTEILCYLQPEKCGIWNRVAREGLRVLGIEEPVDPNSYQLTAQEYAQFNSLQRVIGDELGVAGISGVDLLLVDYFLYEIAHLVPENESRCNVGRVWTYGGN